MFERRRIYRIVMWLMTVILMFYSGIPLSVYASDPIQDGDNQQGTTGSGSSGSYVNTSAPGCFRVYMADTATGAISGSVMDMGNVPQRPAMDYNFGGTKMETATTRTLSPGGNNYAYSPKVPPLGSTMNEMKSFWEQDNWNAAETVASDMGWSSSDIDKLKTGEKVIVMEPVGWFTFEGETYSATATEIALLDQQYGGAIRDTLGSFTHNQLPGYAWVEQDRWWGAGVGHQYNSDGMKYMLSNEEILSQFGMSVVYAEDGTPIPVAPEDMIPPPPTADPNILIIREDEMTQSLKGEMPAKNVKFKVQSMPKFSPSSKSGYEDLVICGEHIWNEGYYDDDGDWEDGYWECPMDGSYSATHSFSGMITEHQDDIRAYLQRNMYMHRDFMKVNTNEDQYKIMAFLDGTLDIRYANNSVFTREYNHPTTYGVSTTPEGPFDEDNVMHFIGHRQGAGKTPIPIAAYMGATSANETYKDFIDEHITYNWGYQTVSGYHFMEHFNGLTDSGEGSYQFKTVYKADLNNGVGGCHTVYAGGDGTASPTVRATNPFVTRVGPAHSGPGASRTCTEGCTAWTVSHCCEAVPGDAADYAYDFPALVELPKVEYPYTVLVEGTVVAPSASNSPLSQQENFNIASTSDDIYTLKSPSPEWTFYPTFKMTADYAPGSQTNAPVWALAAGERTFTDYNVLKIQHRSGRITMTAPWSRDLEDRSHSVNVAKSGQAYRVESTSDIIEVDAWVTVIDPNFVHPDQRDAIIAQNEAIIEEYATAVETIAYAPENAWGTYTNLRQGSSAEALYQVPFVASDKNQEEKPKTVMKRNLRGYNGKVDPFEAYRLDGNVSGRDSVVQTSYSARGFTYTDADVGMPGFWNSETRAQSNLDELLYDAPGHGWYAEDYEGIIVIHMHGEAQLNDGVLTEYASIYRHESDWKTEFNANSKQLIHPYSGRIKVPVGEYGVGVDFAVPTVTVSGKTISGLNVGSRIYSFGVRGSVFDDT